MRASSWPAVEEFLAQGTFRLKQRFENINGLTMLEVVLPSEPGADAGAVRAEGAL